MPRYADCPSLDVELVVAAPPDVVWNLVGDVTVPTRFSPELYRVHWRDTGQEPAVGATFVGYNRHQMLGEWRTLSTVVELSPPQVIAWDVADLDGIFGGTVTESADSPPPFARWRFRVEPIDGATRLHQSARIGPARSGVSLAIDRAPDREEAIVAHRLAELRAGMLTTLEGIKALAEARC